MVIVTFSGWTPCATAMLFLACSTTCARWFGLAGACTSGSGKMMRQIAGAFAEYEKARLIAKLRHARDRVRAERGRCEGRKPVPAETVAAARRLARRSPKTGLKRSLRAISAELAALGHLGPGGKPYFPGSVARILAPPRLPRY